MGPFYRFLLLAEVGIRTINRENIPGCHPLSGATAAVFLAPKLRSLDE